jgi:hypothetical protein
VKHALRASTLTAISLAVAACLAACGTSATARPAGPTVTAGAQTGTPASTPASTPAGGSDPAPADSPTQVSGDADSARPSIGEIAAALRKEGASLVGSGLTMTPNVTQCLARAFEDSRLSDGALRAIVGHDTSYHSSSSDQAVAEQLVLHAKDCVH